MATGIDKKQHRLLIECIEKLIRDGVEPHDWEDRKEKLNETFDELLSAIRQVEQSIANYKNLYASIRPLATSEHRKRNKRK
ncbi:hypothetical protein [Sphingobacterium sp.]|uniref:hypothetical protein n=1 Tax=Sphingobacterium sp. TaxID=341027 RepID=UPI002588D14F|nr:hypothetical protein [Sphingobacterium sp.]WET67021.1 MAG: hypothetical protein P0Y57_14395 [Sphingobacterium sp.]